MAKKFNLKSLIIAKLRRLWLFSPLRREALKGASKVGKNGTTYKCALTKKYFTKEMVTVDHIEPVVPVSGWDGWDGYINRLFCPLEGLQVLSKAAHEVKTKKENVCRKKNTTKKATE